MRFVLALCATASIARADGSLPEIIGVTASATSTLAGSKKTYERRFVLARDAKHTQ